MKRWLCTMIGVLSLGQVWAADTALVISVQGKPALAAGGGSTVLEPFVRLAEGDRLNLPAGSQVAIVFVGKARQETWRGAGSVQLGDGEAIAVAGKPELQVRAIPPEVARQMNRTPVVNQDGRVGMIRLRSVPPPDAVGRLEQQYRELREQAAESDLSPEIFLLAGLFDLRQYERIDNELARLEKAQPRNPAVPPLRQVYDKALAAIRDGK